jgi:choline kinase
MRVLILAAGFASRLRPLTDTKPKCLLEIGGKTILERTLNHLLGKGFRQLGVVTGYLESQISDFIRSRFPEFEVTFIHNAQFQSTNNIYSLYLARDFALGQDLYLLDSDILFDRGILDLMQAYPHPDCLALRSVGTIGEEEMKVSTDPESRITEISKEMPAGSAVGESIGIERFSAGFVGRLFEVLRQMIEKEDLSDQFYEKAFQRVIDQGVPLYAVDVGALKCVEIDTVEDLAHAESEVLQYLDV